LGHGDGSSFVDDGSSYRPIHVADVTPFTTDAVDLVAERPRLCADRSNQRCAGHVSDAVRGLGAADPSGQRVDVVTVDDERADVLGNLLISSRRLKRPSMPYQSTAWRATSSTTAKPRR
jgi:hypothetical protein